MNTPIVYYAIQRHSLLNKFLINIMISHKLSIAPMLDWTDKCYNVLF